MWCSPFRQRSALDLRQRYADAGGFGAVQVRIRCRMAASISQDGKLDYIDPTISATTDTLTARAVFPNPVLAANAPQAGAPSQPAAAGSSVPSSAQPASGTTSQTRELVDGEFVQVLVQGLNPIEVLGVPRSAVLTDQQGDYVFTVDAQNHAQQTRVQLGQSTPAIAAVISGLTEGQTVIAEGMQRVHAGMQVVPGPATPAPVAPPPHAG